MSERVNKLVKRLDRAEFNIEIRKKDRNEILRSMYSCFNLLPNLEKNAIDDMLGNVKEKEHTDNVKKAKIISNGFIALSRLMKKNYGITIKPKETEKIFVAFFKANTPSEPKALNEAMSNIFTLNNPGAKK